MCAAQDVIPPNSAGLSHIFDTDDTQIFLYALAMNCGSHSGKFHSLLGLYMSLDE